MFNIFYYLVRFCWDTVSNWEILYCDTNPWVRLIADLQLLVVPIAVLRESPLQVLEQIGRLVNKYNK